MMPQSLDPLRFPLTGVRLIEASAGTGKTYTITGLYLRLLLGHGPADAHGELTAFARPLAVPEILVVTFTEAATEELRGRIRTRIHQARLAFLRGTAAGDPLLAALLSEVGDHPWAASRLLAAERQMDEAAIFTIHGFCQRMLKQNAFESGALFTNELLTDEGALRLQAVCDFWRQHFYPAPATLVRSVRALWSGPAALLDELQWLIDRPELAVRPAMAQTPLLAYHQQQLERIACLKTAWCTAEEAVRQQTEGVVSRYTGKNYEAWLQAIGRWARQETADYQWPEALPRFQQSVLEANLKKGAPTPQLPLFTEIEHFLATPPNLRALILQRAAEEVRHRLRQAKGREQLLSFDDLLADLDRALATPLGPQLAARVRQLYPVAMIDEFQDTDPQQYRIFHRLYAEHPEATTSLALLMIGDPKQAIYGFRGADIFTYMQARRHVTAHYTLGRNYRSSTALVNAVNTLFAQAKAPFIYEADIPFWPVDANGKADSLLLDGAAAPVLNCWWHDAQPTLNKGRYLADMAQATANQIATLLTGAGQQQVCLGARPLQAGDIAVLVRTGAEGRLVQQQLARLGVASVYLSSRDSVFAQQEAADLLLVLQACQQPESERALRAALATALFDLDATTLDVLSQDEQVWEQTVAEFRDYQHLWQRKGVLVMLQALLQRRNLAASLLGAPLGERRLTNFLHLGELLQQASAELDSDYGLLRWFSEAIAAPGSTAGEQILRLESERRLVQIVTIHKSKGLEYPLVFLPFLCAYRASDSALFHADDGLQLDLSGDPEARAEADKERLAEDLRLLYVALTRAVYACWLGLAPLRSGPGKSLITELHLSAIGYLLQRGEAGDASLLLTGLQALQQASTGVSISAPPLSPVAPLAAPTTMSRPPQVRHFERPLERNWWISSYSALSAAGDHHAEGVLEMPGFDAEAVREERVPDRVATEMMRLNPAAAPELTIFDFPRGANAGTLLHTLFEEIDFAAIHQGALRQQPCPQFEGRIAQVLAQYGYDAHWMPILRRHVEAVLAAELQPGLCLGTLPAEQRQVEMEFLIPMAPLDASALSALMARYDPLSRQAGRLTFPAVQGMLKGFIDLVFEHQGRWYLLDYKSNYLGADYSAYQEPALSQAMLAHRYDLQYQLYTLALHRLLQQRLPGYEPERHLGGVFYLFLRGMPQAGVWHTTVDLALLNALDALFSGEKA